MADAGDDKDKIIYPGKELDITWDRRLCIHIGECGRARNKLFVARREPWCAPDEVSAKDAAEVVCRCPAGALSYVSHTDAVPDEQPPAENIVHVSNNGPFYVTGTLTITGVDPDDMPGTRFRAALCRCGLSKNKPFCDGAHEAGNFRDGGAVGDKGRGFENPGGPLKITPVKDGPLMLQGNFVIVAGSGRRAWQGKKAALCRCGHSNNKPFCDGAHMKHGFKAD